MKWLGLDSDGELIYQSQRLDIYNKYIDQLLESGHAYWCECSPEEVEAMREEARAKGEKPRYNGRCRSKNLGPGEGRVVRLRAPLDGRISFEDMVKGHISVDASELDDMILRRSDGNPTYNLAVVVDDSTMGITHVLRGDDHVNNTPKQILLYQALDLPVPLFGHVPMILGPDRQKLSKRHGAKAVIEYEKDGLLPEALVNYLARLSWAHGDQEIFSMDELITAFDGKGFSSSAAGFDPEKLQWVNAQHLHKLDASKLAQMLAPFAAEQGLPNDQATLEKFAPLFQTRATNLVDLAAQLKPVLTMAADLPYDQAAVEKNLTAEGKAHIAALREIFGGIGDFSHEPLHEAINAYVNDNGLKFKQVGPPLRVSLLGAMGGPDLSVLMEKLGKEESLARLDRALSL